MFLNTLSIGEDCFKRWTKKINNISNSNSSESEHDHEPISLTPSPRVLKNKITLFILKIGYIYCQKSLVTTVVNQRQKYMLNQILYLLKVCSMCLKNGVLVKI